MNVHKVAKNPEVLCKQYASTKKIFRPSNNIMAFLRTLVIALTIHVRIMSICRCPVQIFAIKVVRTSKYTENFDDGEESSIVSDCTRE